jgi:two-component system phosphate regulon sensor histidine kinase PhoR
MELLAAVLGFAAAVFFAWGLWERRARRTAAPPALPAPPPLPATHDLEPLPPLVYAVASQLDAGIIVLDDERQVVYLNPQAEALLGVRAEAARGQGLISILRDYQADALVSDVARDGEPREIVLRLPTGGRTLRLRASTLQADGTHGTLVQLRDVTQLSMLERARRDMVANVSHELRNPLASVKLLVETLQSGPPADVRERMLGQMAQEVDAIAQLVDELHELSQIESGRVALQLRPTPLAPVVTRALERIVPQAERKALITRADVPDGLPPALIDAQRIGQVLLNLLHNAAKFTPAGGTILVRACAITVTEEDGHTGYVERRLVARPLEDPSRERRREHVPPARAGRPAIALPQPLPPGDWLLVSVNDTGIGIPSADIPRIFERFYKVDRARTRNAGGTGLGLAIAKHLIEGHGGRIWATSEEGAGSTFWFVVPHAGKA